MCYKGLHGVTRDYRGLQGVTRGYWGLQGVTRVYRELQGVRRDYRGLQGITGAYRGLQGATRDCKGLLTVTGGCKGLQGVQGVTGGYKRLQGVTRGYRGLQGITVVTGGYKRLQGVTRVYTVIDHRNDAIKCSKLSKTFAKFNLTIFADFFSQHLAQIQNMNRCFSLPILLIALRLLFTCKNGDFSAISISERNCTAPILTVTCQVDVHTAPDSFHAGTKTEKHAG